MDRRLASTWWALKIALGAATVLAGLDKFFNVLAHWTDYLNPMVLEFVPVSPETFMQSLGIVEMIIGLTILTRWTRLGAYLAACWLVVMAANLVSIQKFYDVAVHDLLLAVAAFALARLSALRQEELAGSVAPKWEPSTQGILSLNL
jgi:hypothetical protein